MALQLTPSTSFPQRRPVLVVIADGVGEAPAGPMNAVTQSATPALDRLTDSRLYRTLKAHGPAVGLPSWDDMGNSEVGHNALGAGKIIAQGAALVDIALAEKSIFSDPGWEYIKPAFAANTLHIITLLSSGGVHSRYDQLKGIMDGAVADGCKKLRLHVLTDGRDVPDNSCHEYMATLVADWLQRRRAAE